MMTIVPVTMTKAILWMLVWLGGMEGGRSVELWMRGYAL